MKGGSIGHNEAFLRGTHMINRYLRLAVSSCCLLRSTVHWSKPSTPSKVNESQIIVYSNRIQQGTRLKYGKMIYFCTRIRIAPTYHLHHEGYIINQQQWQLMATMLTLLAQWSINSGCRCGWSRLECCLFLL